ncbi:MAG: hypothetical protein GDA37_02095 [Ekhidna sp.]|nr:hypothetical protein [Ekhidna sp.]
MKPKSIHPVRKISPVRSVDRIKATKIFKAANQQCHPNLSQFLRGYTSLFGAFKRIDKATKSQYQLDIRAFEVSIKTGLLGLENDDIKIML